MLHEAKDNVKLISSRKVEEAHNINFWLKETPEEAEIVLEQAMYSGWDGSLVHK